MPLSQPASSLMTSRPTESVRPLDVSAADMLVIEKGLSQYVGPMAKVLIRKEAARSATYKQLVDAVSQNIDDPEQRKLFLAALRRALPNR
jgi:hypothetical protein